jgi:hypothetical protein
LGGDEKLHNGDIGGENMVDVGVDLHVEDGESPRWTSLMFLDDGIHCMRHEVLFYVLAWSL